MHRRTQLDSFVHILFIIENIKRKEQNGKVNYRWN